MKKQKYIPVRRRKALRRLLLLAALLTAVALNIVPCRFLPSQALRDFENDRLTGRTKVIEVIPRPPMKLPGLWRFTLSENENAVVFSGQRFRFLLGWVYDGGAECDCSGGEAPVYAAYNHLDYHTIDNQCYVFFGRVADPRIEALEIIADYSEYQKELSPSILCPKQKFYTEGKSQAFCLCAVPELHYNEHGYAIPCKPLLNAYDAEGMLIYSEHIDQGWSTSIG